MLGVSYGEAPRNTAGKFKIFLSLSSLTYLPEKAYKEVTKWERNLGALPNTSLLVKLLVVSKFVYKKCFIDKS